MRPATILILLAGQLAFGQPQQPAAPPRLRVALRVDSPEQRVRQLFEQQLRKLNDVELVTESSGAFDLELQVQVSDAHGVDESSRSARRYAIALKVARSGEQEKPRAAPAGTPGVGQAGFIPMEDLQNGKLAAAWMTVAEEKDVETTCANLVNKFDRDVVQAPSQAAPVLETPPPDASDDFSVPLPPLVVVYDTPPALIHKVPPKYSEDARRAGIQGVVVLYAEVDASGRVASAQVVRSLGFGLDEQAVEAVTKWRFKPALKHGQPVPFATAIEVSFSLHN